MDKEKTIHSIKQRILDEHRKHHKIDWAEIAARKIYSSFISFQTCLNCGQSMSWDENKKEW